MNNTDKDETILMAGELRDIDDDFVCAFGSGSIFRDDEDEYDIGWLELIQIQGTPSLLKIKSGLYKFIINDILCIIDIGEVTMTDGIITAYYTSTGLDVDLKKYREDIEKDEPNGEPKDFPERYREDIDPDDPESFEVTFQNIGITEDTEFEPCLYTNIDGSEIWFANPKALGESLGYCEYHTREILNDVKAISTIFLDKDRCDILGELLIDIEENNHPDGLMTILMKPKGNG